MSEYYQCNIEDIVDSAKGLSPEFVAAVCKYCSDFDILVELYSYSPYRPAVMYLKNGDPGDPPEEEEWDFSEDEDTLAEKTMRKIITELPYRFAIPSTEAGFLQLLVLRDAVDKFAGEEMERIKELYLEKMQEDDYE